MDFKIIYWTIFSRADMAGLGKYHAGGYGRIWVYRVKPVQSRLKTMRPSVTHCMTECRNQILY